MVPSHGGGVGAGRSGFHGGGPRVLLSRRDEFRKAPTANVTVHLLPGVHRIGWYSIARTHAFILTVWFRKERREALFCVDIKRLSVQSREYHEGRIGGLAKEGSSLHDI